MGAHSVSLKRTGAFFWVSLLLEVSEFCAYRIPPSVRPFVGVFSN